MNNYVKSLIAAFRQAARTARKTTTGLPPIDDPDLRRYMSLRPEDFEVLRQTYGLSQTIDYVQEMERQLKDLARRK